MLVGIRAAFRDGTYRMRQHFLDRLFERGLDMSDIAEAIRGDAPEVIEDYPSDERGASCLILCQGPTARLYHVHCGYPPAVWLVTVYEPDPAVWMPGFRRRR